jgi:hypothetical protein
MLIMFKLLYNLPSTLSLIRHEESSAVVNQLYALLQHLSEACGVENISIYALMRLLSLRVVRASFVPIRNLGLCSTVSTGRTVEATDLKLFALFLIETRVIRPCGSTLAIKAAVLHSKSNCSTLS